ncbi:phage tail protein [Microvirga solisilvae]|uniref:phage tail protein n=1 Tax=Microvirga solisilvae TaxID=2919498 RepID=UPI001FAFD567|nr:phage tail protein [Microvirga solisilvae]
MSNGVVVVDIDLDTLRPIERDLLKVGNQAPHAIRRGINKTGDKGRTPYVRAIAKQMGLKVGVVRKRIRVRRANYDRMEYRVIGFGGPIPLIHFNARETRSGVSHTADGQRKVLKGSFIKGGRFPTRRALKIGPQVWLRTSAKRTPLEKQEGPAVPERMLEDPAIGVFRSTAEARLIPNILHEIDAIMNGWAPRG